MENKEGRIPKIVQMLRKIKLQGRISRNEAAEVQGHPNFAQGFFTSKSLKFVLGQFDSLSKVQGSGAAKKLAKLCEVTEHILTALPPRKFSACAMQSPFLLFTDGAWESGLATAGLLLYNPDSRELIVQEIEVPEQLTQLWLREVGQAAHMPDRVICLLSSQV